MFQIDFVQEYKQTAEEQGYSSRMTSINNRQFHSIPQAQQKLIISKYEKT